LYTSPKIGGLSGELAYAFGEQPDNNTAGRQFGAALGYSAGPLNARVAYNSRNNDAATNGSLLSVPLGTNIIVAANYDFSILRGYVAYSRDKGPNSAPLPNASNPYGGIRPTASTDSAEYLLGFSAPALGGTVMASYINKDDKTMFDQDASQVGAAYAYPMSKRTNLYLAYAYIRNRRGAGYTVGNNAEAGSGNRAFNAGLRSYF
jgi:predicted porin